MGTRAYPESWSIHRLERHPGDVGNVFRAPLVAGQPRASRREGAAPGRCCSRRREFPIVADDFVGVAP
jgi:hypothetical protein